MRKTMVVLLYIISYTGLSAQQNLGIRNSNYAGIQGALLNPASIADSKLNWDVNVLSGDVVFANNFLWAPKKAVPLFGFRRIIKGSFDEDLFATHFDPQNPNKLYNVTLSTEILGPSFFMKIAKKHSIGLTIAGRAYGNIKDISGNLGQNAFDYFLNRGLWNTDLQDNATRINGMSWLEYGLHYATVLYSRGTDELKVGISLNYLQGIAAAYVKNSNITYRISDTTNLAFTNTSLDYGRTNTDTYRKISSYNDLNQGHGFGADIGLVYVHYKDQYALNEEPTQHSSKDDYVYKLGLSLLDLGSINFNKNAAAYHLRAANANFANWHESKFTGNDQLDRTLSAVFYNGDSAKSQVSNRFRMGMPAALSIQADWNLCTNFFANMTIVKGFGHGSNQGVVRPDVYSITPRWETKWYEISIPVSVLYYNHWQPRVGLAARAGYFFIGGDAPGSLLKLNDLQGVDFYAGVHFFIAEKQQGTKTSTK
jgi:hypothetical protein